MTASIRYRPGNRFAIPPHDSPEPAAKSARRLADGSSARRHVARIHKLNQVMIRKLNLARNRLAAVRRIVREKIPAISKGRRGSKEINDAAPVVRERTLNELTTVQRAQFQALLYGKATERGRKRGRIDHRKHRHRQGEEKRGIAREYLGIKETGHRLSGNYALPALPGHHRNHFYASECWPKNLWHNR